MTFNSESGLLKGMNNMLAEMDQIIELKNIELRDINNAIAI